MGRTRYHVQRGLPEGEGPVEVVALAGEWDSLQVSCNISQFMNRDTKSATDLVHANAILLPSPPVHRAATPSAHPPPLLEDDQMPARKPNSAPEHNILSLM